MQSRKVKGIGVTKSSTTGSIHENLQSYLKLLTIQRRSQFFHLGPHIPQIKKQTQRNPTNYPPITYLPTINKILKTIITSKVDNY